MDEEITQVRPVPPPTPESTLLGGTYELGDAIGSGLLGVVYDARNVVARKPCAVKLFRPDLPGGAVARGRYVHETERIGQLGPPNAAAIYRSATAEQGRLYTVMERLEGASLTQLLRQQAPLSRRAYVPLIRELGAALAAAHAMGLAHLHLHPGQVLLQWTGHGYDVRLLDFGTHHLLPKLTDAPSGWSWEAPQATYFAPEQIKATPSHGDARTDIYALSVMLYEMVTGRVPFQGQTFAATLEAHVNDAPPPPSQLVSLASGLEEAILRGLEKDPGRRPQSMEAFLAAVDPDAVTGAHALALQPGATGRHRALTADVSREIELPDAADMAAAAMPPPPPQTLPLPVEPMPPDEGLPLKKSRRWLLFVVLAVVALGCAAAVTLLLLDDGDAPAPKLRTPRTPRPKAKRPAGPHRAPPAPAPSKAPPPRPQAPAAAPEAPAGSPAGKPKDTPPLTTRRELPGRRSPRSLAKRGLRPIKGIGTLEVRTPSPQAQVFVNGRFRGKGKLVVVPRLPSGVYRVHLVLDGKKSPHRDVALEPKQRLVVTF